MKYTELSDTVDLMQSADYKDRFKAEFYQLDIRITKLEAVITRERNGEIKFTCPVGMLQEQLAFMKAYKALLITRAEAEEIIL
jgi:hypothetical protein